MKNLWLSAIVLLATTTNAFSQNIAINEKGDLPDTSAMLDISSTTKGFLAPRMQTTQQNAINLPATGLLIFNTTTGTFNVNTGTPATPNWIPLSFNSGPSTNILISSGNTITSTVDGNSATAPAVNSVVNTIATNSLTTKVNGISAAAVNMITANALSLSGSKLKSTVNGIASGEIDLTTPVTANAWGLKGNGGTTAGTNYLGTTNAVDFVAKTNDIERLRITSGGNVGIGTSTPSNALHVVSSANPLLLSGLKVGAISDSILTVNTSTGVVRYLSTERFTGSSDEGSSTVGWGLSGNSGTSNSSFIGTTDGKALTFKVNGIQAGYLGLSGASNATSFGVNSSAEFAATAIGAGAKANTSNEATAIGYNANAAGYKSIAIGSGAETANTNDAIAIGTNAKANTYQGIAIGAGASTLAANNSAAIGVGAKATGYQSLAIGNGATATGQNATAIGNGASANNNNYVAIGNSTVSSIRGQVNFATYSDGRFKRNIKADVPGLDFILKLRPVTYKWDIRKFNAYSFGGDYKMINAGYSDGKDREEAIRNKEKITYTGFIAQEVEAAAEANHFNFSGVLKPTSDKDAYSLSYAEFVVPLVKAVQELNEKNEQLMNKLNTQQAAIDLLLKELKQLKNK